MNLVIYDHTEHVLSSKGKQNSEKTKNNNCSFIIRLYAKGAQDKCNIKVKKKKASPESGQFKRLSEASSNLVLKQFKKQGGRNTESNESKMLTSKRDGSLRKLKVC